MEATPKIFVIDDEQRVLDSFAAIIRTLGYEPVLFTDRDLPSVCERARSEMPEIVIIDYHLSPVIKGESLMLELRAAGVSAPFLFVSGDDDPQMRAAMLNQEADDFIRKPSSPVEIKARIRALLRRKPVGGSVPPFRPNSATAPFQFAGCTISPESKTISGPKKQDVPLASRHLSVLILLYQSNEAVVTRAQITHAIWGIERTSKSRILDQTVYEAKRRIETAGGDPHCIRSSKGLGYRYFPPQGGR